MGAFAPLVEMKSGSPPGTLRVKYSPLTIGPCCNCDVCLRAPNTADMVGGESELVYAI